MLTQRNLIRTLPQLKGTKIVSLDSLEWATSDGSTGT